MDIRCIFLNQLPTFERRGDAAQLSHARGWLSVFVCRGCQGGKSPWRIGPGRQRVEQKCEAKWLIVLSRKTSSELVTDRTANRHR